VITLTAAEPIRVKLGANNTVPYDKMVLDNITHSPVNRTISATVRLSVAADPLQPVINGSLIVDVQGLKVTLTMNSPLNFTHVTPLDANGATTVQTWINTAQQNLEQGLVNVGAVAGIQAAGV
jgi:hypothetical protein